LHSCAAICNTCREETGETGGTSETGETAETDETGKTGETDVPELITTPAVMEQQCTSQV
ncbi:hypothetical protein DVA76_18080, partial [Acinetobacter baumannii]